VTSRGKDIEALLRVWHRATQFILDNPAETCEIVARACHEPPSTPQALMRTDRILDSRFISAID
jgi:ABC-type nitrate/sulfonate/bicarbonate transport system substrate-binding protein